MPLDPEYEDPDPALVTELWQAGDELKQSRRVWKEAEERTLLLLKKLERCNVPVQYLVKVSRGETFLVTLALIEGRFSHRPFGEIYEKVVIIAKRDMKNNG